MHHYNKTMSHLLAIFTLDTFTMIWMTVWVYVLQPKLLLCICVSIGAYVFMWTLISYMPTIAESVCVTSKYYAILLILYVNMWDLAFIHHHLFSDIESVVVVVGFIASRVVLYKASLVLHQDMELLPVTIELP